MALVNVSNVIVHNNPTHFTAPFQFEVTFECVQELQDGECPCLIRWLCGCGVAVRVGEERGSGVLWCYVDGCCEESAC